MKTLFNLKEIESLECDHCGKDLLNPPDGHLLMKDEWKGDQMIVSDIRWLCRSCDKHDPYRNWGWKELSDLFIPDVLVQWILGILIGLHTKREAFSDEAMEKMIKFLLIIFPHISKKITPRQRDTLKSLYEIPRCIGGLG
jgi:hypothetical protein